MGKGGGGGRIDEVCVPIEMCVTGDRLTKNVWNLFMREALSMNDQHQDV